MVAEIVESVIQSSIGALFIFAICVYFYLQYLKKKNK
jgi:ABC-type multidrug transport system permease subunit